jgi:hypothetical protein
MKKKYYIEWWITGGKKENFKSGIFHHSCVEEFLMTFLETGRYNLMFLRDEDNGEILYNNRR